MFVVPFFCRAPIQSLIPWSLQPIVVFLENRGKQLCQVDLPAEWLSENGFSVKNQWKVGDIVYVEVDAEKTALRDFYSFEQLSVQQQKGTEECWRTFFTMKSAEDTMSSLAWNKNIESPFFDVLQEIQKKCKL
jgi:hypothetical protein